MAVGTGVFGGRGGEGGRRISAVHESQCLTLRQGGETHFLHVGHSRRVASFVLQPMHLVMVGGGRVKGEGESEDEEEEEDEEEMKQGNSDRGLFIGRRILAILGRSMAFGSTAIQRTDKGYARLPDASCWLIK